MANEEHLTITVAHYPPATSKWNKIEHRLFSFISLNWRATPLTSLEVVLELISHTTTAEGLMVTARKDSQTYPTGLQVTDDELAALNLVRDAFHGDWNYTIKPRDIVVNHQAEVVFGYTAQELLDQPLNRLLPEQFHELHDALLAQYVTHPHARVMGTGLNVLGRHHDGRALQLEISLNPLLGARPLCILCVIRDVSERRDTEQVKDEFVALAAHTLQTPLTALHGYVDTLLLHTRHGKGVPLSEWQLDAVDEIRIATERLEMLAETLLDGDTHSGWTAGGTS